MSIIGTYCECERWDCFYHRNTDCFEPGATFRVDLSGRERLYCLDCAIENLRTRREAEVKCHSDG